MLGNEHSQCNKPLNEAKLLGSGMLWAALDFKQTNKHISAWLTCFHVCISSMTGYTCCKALAGIVCHWAIRNSPGCTVIQSENINHETGDIFQVKGWVSPHFWNQIVPTSATFFLSHLLAGDLISLVRLPCINKMQLTLFSNVLPACHVCWLYKALTTRNHPQFQKYSIKHKRPSCQLESTETNKP